MYNGIYRKIRLEDCIVYLDSSETVRQTRLRREDTVRTAWRHAELGRNVQVSA